MNENRENRMVELFRRSLLRTKQVKTIAEGKSNAEATLQSSDVAHFGAKGYVTIEAIYPDGRVKTLLKDKPNMVVTQAEQIMAYMSVGLRPMSYIELGDKVTPTAPALTDITLQQTTGERKAIAATVTGNSVAYVSTWLVAEGNGYDFTEAGLFCDPFGAGLLFARKTFDPITKTAAFALRFTWTVVFQIANTNSGCSGVSIVSNGDMVYDYTYTAVGGETDITVPIDFVVGAKTLDVYLNTAGLAYNTHYYELVISPIANGIRFIGFSLIPGDLVYFKRQQSL